jgi:serralysin
MCMMRWCAMMQRRTVTSLVVASIALLAATAPVSGFIINPSDPDPWLSTASGPRSGNGDPATLTWSIVPDGTTMNHGTDIGTSPSNLISFLNSNFGGNPAQTDLTQQPWFDLLEESFGRWAELSGVTYVYEPNDDGVFHPSSSGQLGVRGDIRIGGFNVDGASGTLAFTYLPTIGSDMAFDTGDATFFTNSANGHINFRNTATHEIGHSFGALHVNSTSSLLMEPIINTSFDGPQLDEVRAVQYFFGDANEKSNGGLGNDTPGLATSLGTIAAGATATVGADADVPGQAISASATDFVSISNVDDTDFYSFTVSQPSLLSATLTPRGGVFTQAPEGQTPTTFNANARSDLALTVFDTNGVSDLGTASMQPAGTIESLSDVMLPAAGTYYARIMGADDTIQLYELSLSVVASLLPGDYNFDGSVDAADYAVWRKNPADYGSDPDGYNTWRAHFGQTAGAGAATGQAGDALAAVPEPTSVILMLLGVGLWTARGRK